MLFCINCLSHCIKSIFNKLCTSINCITIKHEGKKVSRENLREFHVVLRALVLQSNLGVHNAACGSGRMLADHYRPRRDKIIIKWKSEMKNRSDIYARVGRGCVERVSTTKWHRGGDTDSRASRTRSSGSYIIMTVFQFKSFLSDCAGHCSRCNLAKSICFLEPDVVETDTTATSFSNGLKESLAVGISQA